MNQIERRDKGMAYVCDDEAFAQQAECRKLLQQLNFMERSDFDGIKEVVKKLFGKSADPFVNPPFYCDYGFNIEVGKEFFANYNCTIIDVAKVKIGDNCMRRQCGSSSGRYDRLKFSHRRRQRSYP